MTGPEPKDHMRHDSQENAIPSVDEYPAFLAEHYDRIFAFAWRVLGNREDAKDLTQEICMSLPVKLGAFRWDCKTTTWLYRIVTNAANDRLRKRKTKDRYKQDCSLALVSMAEEGRERTERQTWLVDAFLKLPEELRVTASMLVEEGLSQAEAAERLDIAPGTIAWRMSKIKKRLRDVAREEDHVG